MISSLKEAIGFCCEPLPTKNGYGFSLTTLLGHFLSIAEMKYGPRNKNWTILGIEFCGEIPHVWYPGNMGYISIMLADMARLNPAEAIFELAHEVVHLLSPNGGGPAKTIEEGVATIFAHQNSPIRGGQASYLEAERLVKELLAIDDHAIRKLREKRPAFSDFTPEFILENYSISWQSANALCATFDR
jgi:hypothetical protein